MSVIFARVFSLAFSRLDLHEFRLFVAADVIFLNFAVNNFV